jgi:hypothetical protein
MRGCAAAVHSRPIACGVATPRLRRQGLVQGRHAPLPPGLPDCPPPPEAAGTAPSVAGAMGEVAAAAAAAVSSFTDGAAPRKASLEVITSGHEAGTGPGAAPPDAEVVRRVLSEHGARVRAEALGEAQVELVAVRRVSA